MSNPAQEFEEKWSSIELERCPKDIKEQLSLEEVSRRIAVYLKESYDHLTDIDRARKIHSAVKIEGSIPEDFLNRSLACEFGDLMTSIRFVGGDLSKPFVKIIHQSFKLDSLSKIQSVATFLKEEYSNFQPRRVQWYCVENSDNILSFSKNISADLQWVYGFLAQLKKFEQPKHYGKIQLELAKDLSWYDGYTAGFDKLIAANPFFVEMAKAESRETLEGLRSKGLLYECYIENELAGIIAVDEFKEFLFGGYLVYEEFLFEKFRAKGFAAALQRHLIDLLPAGENTCLFGTIHHGNPASLRTAIRVGRKLAGTYLFYSFE